MIEFTLIVPRTRNEPTCLTLKEPRVSLRLTILWLEAGEVGNRTHNRLPITFK